MSKVVNRAENSKLRSMDFPGASFLAMLPVLVIFYLAVALPLWPGEGKTRLFNVLIWPIMALITVIFAFKYWALVDRRFLRSLPITSLFAYLLFAIASVTWAYSPDFALSRVVVQVLAVIIIIVPFALPISVKSIIPGVHFCYVVAFALSALYVLNTPPTPVGHPGYFTHKQELGLLAAVGIMVASHELLFSGWRRFVALFTISLGFWLIFESESKSALAFALIALVGSWLILQICKRTRLTPAIIVAAIVLASMFVANPIERLGYRLYGDATLTGRTGIWTFIDYQISHRPWFGWGFHSYYFVPNSPHNEAPGYIKDMPSSHSGFLELKLETGRIGYWIFLVFVYASLHLLERVRRIDPVRAWYFLSVELFAVLINLLDSNWLVLTHFWLLFLIVVAESIRFSLASTERAPAPAGAVRSTRLGPHRPIAGLTGSAPP